MNNFGCQVLELQDCISRLQNKELQNQLSPVEKSDQSTNDRKDNDAATRSPWKQVRSHKKPLQIELRFNMRPQSLFFHLSLVYLQSFVHFVHIFQILDKSYLSHFLTSTFY